MNESFLVLSGIGPDRPGLVALVTDFIRQRGGNVEESRMALLGAEFGLMLLVSGAHADLTLVEADLPALERSTGMAMLARQTTNPRDHRATPLLPYTITADAIDREGIIHAVAVAIHGLGVNIVSLDTSSFNAPFSGGVLFKMQARVDLPGASAVAGLRDALAEVARRENLDIEIRASSAG